MIHMIETVHEMDPRCSFEELHGRFVETFRYGVSPIEAYVHAGRHFHLAKPRNAHRTPEKLPYGTVHAGEGMPIHDGTNDKRWLASYFDVMETGAGKFRVKVRTSLPEFFKRDDTGLWLRAPQVTQAMRVRWAMLRRLLCVPQGGSFKRVTHFWRKMELCWQVRCASPHLPTIGDLLVGQDPGGLGWQSTRHHYGQALRAGVYRKVYAKGVERANRGRGRGASLKGVEAGLSDLLRCEVSLGPTDAQERVMAKILNPVTGALDRQVWYDTFRKYMPHQVAVPDARITVADRQRIKATYSAAEGIALCALMNDAEERTGLFQAAAEDQGKYGKLARRLRAEMDRCEYDLKELALSPPDDYNLFTHICEAWDGQGDKHAAENPFHGVPAHLIAHWEEQHALLTV